MVKQTKAIWAMRLIGHFKSEMIFYFRPPKLTHAHLTKYFNPLNI